MKLIKTVGATSEIWQVFVQDSSSTTGAGLTGLVFNSGSLSAYYHRDTDTTATAITLATMTVGTFTSSGFKEIDATNMPGWYQFCPPNAALASGAKSCAFHLKGATNMAPLPIEVQLTAGFDFDTATPAVNTTKVGGTSQTGRDLGASVLLSSGTGTGQLSFTSGVVQADAAKINAVSTSSVTTINAHLGTTQPVNFTGTAGSALVKSDMVDVAGAAVSTASAQIGVNVVSFASGQAPLQPTVAGRTLDVSATGEAGLDWANIGAPTTSVNLSGTSTKAVEPTVAGRTLDVSSGGEAGIDWANVGTPGATVGLSATTVATVTTTTTATTATNVTTVNGLAAGVITATSIAANAITAAKIATDAIGAAQLAADAVDEIWDEAVDGTVTARQSWRLANSAAGAKLSGAATTAIAIRDLADTKDRVTATVDANGNRTAVTRDLT